MQQRVKEEFDLLQKQFPDATCGDSPCSWILIPDYPLPAGRFTKECTQLLFRLPDAYPNAGPDDFFVDGDLRLQGGGEPPSFRGGSNSSSGEAPVPGNWGWFSWHPDPNTWRPAATLQGGDNLLSFLRSVNICLRGEDTP